VAEVHFQAGVHPARRRGRRQTRSSSQERLRQLLRPEVPARAWSASLPPVAVSWV